MNEIKKLKETEIKLREESNRIRSEIRETIADLLLHVQNSSVEIPYDMVVSLNQLRKKYQI